MKKLIGFILLILSLSVPTRAQNEPVLNPSTGINILWQNILPPSSVANAPIYVLNFPPNAVSFSVTIQAHTSTLIGTLNVTIDAAQPAIFGATSLSTSVPGEVTLTPYNLTCLAALNGASPVSTLMNSISNGAAGWPFGATCPVPPTGAATLQVTSTAGGTTDAFIQVYSTPMSGVSGLSVSGTNGTPIQQDSSGRVSVAIQSTAVDGQSLGASGVLVGGGGSANNLSGGLQVLPFVYNGTNLDLTVKCPTAVAISVAAAATQQVVAPVSGKKVRVCAMFLSVSTGGTLSFTEGTGATCATGTTTIGGPMTLPVGMSPIMSSGNSVLQTNVVGDGFCLTSGTAAVQGWAQVENH